MSTKCKHLLFVLLLLLSFYIFYLLLFSTKFKLNTEKSRDINNPVSISAGEKIVISVERGTSDLKKIYAFWNDEQNNKVYLENLLFSSHGSIIAPNDKGIHTLIIQYGHFSNIEFYYLIE